MGKILLWILAAIADIKSIFKGSQDKVHPIESMLNFIDIGLNIGEMETLDDTDCFKYVQFFAATKSTGYEYLEVYIDDVASLKAAGLTGKNKLLVAVHGFLSSHSSPGIRKLKTGAEKLGIDFLGVGWGRIAETLLYEEAAKRVLGVGSCLANFINFLVTEGNIPKNSIHLVGHSLGAHVCGFAGKIFKKKYRLAINRISGLDPAGPLFNKNKPNARLNRKDAHFVDCIFTSRGQYGHKKPICTVNFDPNEGEQCLQPSCKRRFVGRIITAIIGCSHGISVDYFVESMNRTHVFEAERCTDLDDNPVDCQGALMGYPPHKNFSRGIAYLNTNAKYPYTGIAAIANIFKGLFERDKILIESMLEFINNGLDIEEMETLDDTECSHYVKFYVATKLTGYEYVEVDIHEDYLLTAIGLTGNNKVLVAVHGFLNSHSSSGIRKLKAGAEELGIDFIGVGWGKLAKTLLYDEAARKVLGVGGCLADFINFLVTEGNIPKNSIHLVGHSLGAHVCGFAGKIFKKKYRMKINRISGLDPAGPLFNENKPNARLDRGDAHSIDCIFTSRGQYGHKKPICTVNFNPNKGQRLLQPSCKRRFVGRIITAIIGCAHGISVDYFVESMKESHDFKAEYCTDLDGHPVDCQGALMGYPPHTNFSRGIAYLTTNSKYPYGKKP
ncbi:hypothetical protein GE061_004451 [Apolygus lucorum]|uniref:Lipase domain-containing protein n=1 Tax=Apolygus lucorum TaxID=248454 RepID=A0A8S9X0R3_APOLU|nr:hypothetical protein GE061_004451 [Apolygus lucorum]